MKRKTPLGKKDPIRKSNMLKKCIIIFLIVINICLLTGCYTEIDQQIMVSGIGVDVGEKGYKYHVSAEIVLVSKDEIKTSVIDTNADTIFDALRDLIYIGSKKLYFGHCKSMFICEKVAEKGIGDVIDILMRDHETRNNMDVFIAKGCNAKKILMTDGIIVPVVSYKSDSLFQIPEKNIGDAPAVDAYKVFNHITHNGMSTVIAAFEIASIEDKKDIELCGAGVFKDDKLIGYLDIDEARNLSIISSKLKKGLLTYEYGEEKNSFISYEIMDNKANTKIEFGNDNIKSVNVSTETKVKIGETDMSFDFKKEDEIAKLCQNLEEKMEENFKRLIKKAQTDLGTDIFRIGRHIQRNHPKEWEKYKEEWDETFKTLDFNVDCKVEIIGTGIINESYDS